MAAEENTSPQCQKELEKLASEATIPLNDILKSYGIEIEDEQDSMEMKELETLESTTLAGSGKYHSTNVTCMESSPDGNTKTGNGEGTAGHVNNPMFDPGGSFNEDGREEYLGGEPDMSHSTHTPDVIEDSDEDFSADAVNAHEEMASQFYTQRE